MACKVGIVPVHVRAYDDALRTTVRRVVGYRAVCSCEWRGKAQRTVRDARIEAREHRQREEATEHDATAPSRS